MRSFLVTWNNLRGDPSYMLAVLLLIISRPVADMFWHLKKAHVLFTPSQWIGTILFILLCVMLIRKRRELSGLIRVHIFASINTVLMIIASAGLLLNELTNFSIEYSVKFLTPWFLLIASVIYLKEKRQITFFLYAVMLSSLIAMGMLYYEILIEPIAVSHRNGMTRFVGLYRQVSAYGIFMMWGLISVLYLTRAGVIRSKVPVVAYFCIAMLALPMIVHLSTYTAVAVMVLLLGVYYWESRKYYQMLFIGCVLAAALTFSLSHTLNKDYRALILPNVEVLSGERDVGHLANGRGAIWKENWEVYSSQSWFAQIFGSMWTGYNHYKYLGFGAHSDFFRILNTGGILGLLIYLSWLAWIASRIRFLDPPERYLLVSTMTLLVAFSVALCATFIATIVMFVMPVFGWLSSGALRSASIIK